MALRIETFDNATGGNTLYKALTHPRAARPVRELLAALAGNGPVAIVEPDGGAAAFADLFDLAGVEIAGVYVRQVERLGAMLLGRRAEPVTGLGDSGARSVFVVAFDADRLIAQLDGYLPPGAAIFSLDAMRIPTDWLTNRRTYLDPLNFATNFAFFRDTDRLHTRVATVNYWSSYGGGPVACWLTLFDAAGDILAEWCESCGTAARSIIFDSRDIRARCQLPEFCGQLFLHMVGAAGHDVVKYALDTFGDGSADLAAGGDRSLSATHDANAWPADRYAGLPAPAPGEQVVLWVQNSHPIPIPAGAIGLSPMGEERVTPIAEPIAPFASRAVDVAELLPDLSWPQQIELRAGKHMVRPRYEVIAHGRRRIAHVNVERADLYPDPNLPRLVETLGKGYLLPAPVLPRALWQTAVLPTPMTVRQAELPIAAIVYDPEGHEVLRHPFGRLPRAHAAALDLDAIAGLDALGESYGHVELVYDFSKGGEGDGWLHAIFRYRERATGHAAETSFGAHVFNTVLTYRDEPQSYSGRPPGLSTRLFLRVGDRSYDTMCHLIYPASQPWRPASATEIILYDGSGGEIARRSMAVPCSGSRLWRYHALFDAAARARAGAGAYAVIRDATCRLFGYHGLLGADGAFSFDHLFGF
ncbi:MAG TPA: hypothetical protein VGM07_08565 [Stellaceae bacterium]|jgi:hypothetical protein